MMRSLALVLCACVAAAACGGSGATDPATTSGPDAIADATPESFRSTLADLEGKPVVVNFWATWCPPCVEEMPRLQAAAERYEGRVHFLGVNVEDDPQAAAEFLDEHGITFPSIGDPDGAIREEQKILGMPTTEFYRADGELGFVHRGEISAEELEEKTEEILKVDTP